MTNLYTSTFAAFYERYFSGRVREFSPQLVDYMAHVGTTKCTLLDLCCGTGEAAHAFCEAGWRVVAVDRSPSMLAIARERLATMIEANQVSLMEADARTLLLSEVVGACICLDGALNHLETIADLQRCFVAVANALVDEGRFVFDLYTLSTPI